VEHKDCQHHLPLSQIHCNLTTFQEDFCGIDIQPVTKQIESPPTKRRRRQIDISEEASEVVAFMEAARSVNGFQSLLSTAEQFYQESDWQSDTV
jgi:hypothetical protein